MLRKTYNSVKAEKNLISELEKTGTKINDIYDLVNSSNPCPEETIQILVKFLDLIDINSPTFEGLVRSLATKQAEGIANSKLLELYNKIDNQLIKWVIANSLSVIATEEDYQKIYEIIKNKSNGLSRQMLVLWISKYKAEKTTELLAGLLDNEDILLQVATSLYKIRTQKSFDLLKSLENSKNKSVKKIVLKALKNNQNYPN